MVVGVVDWLGPVVWLCYIPGGPGQQGQPHTAASSEYAVFSGSQQTDLNTADRLTILNQNSTPSTIQFKYVTSKRLRMCKKIAEFML